MGFTDSHGTVDRRAKSQNLTRGLKTLEDDESWLVVPEHIVGNPNLYRPGVKWNIRAGRVHPFDRTVWPRPGRDAFSRLEEAIEIVRAPDTD